MTPSVAAKLRTNKSPAAKLVIIIMTTTSVSRDIFMNRLLDMASTPPQMLIGFSTERFCSVISIRKRLEKNLSARCALFY
jgi:hypothetical protein